MLDRRGVGRILALGLSVVASGCPDDGVLSSGSGSSGDTGATPGESTAVVTTLGNDSVADATSASTTGGSSGGASSTGAASTGSTTSGEDTTSSSSTGGSSSGDATGDSSTHGGSTGTGSTGTGSTGGCANETEGTTGESDVCVGPAAMVSCDNPSPYDAVGSCDPYAQDCPVGQKCMPFSNDGGGSWNATTCTTLAENPGQIGDACTVEDSGVSGVDDCDIGHMCWNVDVETNIGTCIELCSCGPDEPTCGGGGTTCSIANEGVLPLCLPACDPLAGDCADGEVCVGVPDTVLGVPSDYFFCIFGVAGEMVGVGDPCDFLNACPVGMMCLDAASVPGCAGAGGCCTGYCDLDNGDADCSDPGSGCVGMYENSCPPEACHSDLGYCGV